MKVVSLKFSDFRNLKDNIIFPGEGTNVIYGDNAQGKTNLLEAIWLFSGGHSFRGSKESELTKFGSKNSLIEMEFESQGRNQNASILFSGNKKQIHINDVKKTSSAYLSECFGCVVFSPEHLALVKNGPSLRRRFVDGAICQQNIKFAVLLSKYNRTLVQRNSLLKEIYKHPELKETLCIWDDSLILLGAKIIFKRLEYISKLNVIAKEYHNGISKGKEELFIDYVSSAGISLDDNEEKIIEKLKQSFEKCRKEDIKLSCTNCGPHRDDLEFFINSMKAKNFGSQGQQRSIVLSLKLAEAKMLWNYFSEPPVVLLDDVLSEIDRNRQEFLLLNSKGCQTFITGCEAPVIEDENIKIFTVNNGEVM
ncbi:MAG: DNA replication/repair protein RecF [Ruminococcus sp.]|nr:DNA replication/repair protein RecF [Oscillospiraceae bacterium]MBR2723969.1 DNA replication/repair protein RecF [Ruminococcus sp.]